MKKDAIIHCPTCKKRFAYFSSQFRPFCTERCKMVDLGHWFDESYAVSGLPNVDEFDSEFASEFKDEADFEE